MSNVWDEVRTYTREQFDAARMIQLSKDLRAVGCDITPQDLVQVVFATAEGDALAAKHLKRCK